MNELSNTIDLESTLIRAEALFRRFQRLVETIDKKGNFPPPRPLKSPEPAKVRPGSSSTTENPSSPGQRNAREGPASPSSPRNRPGQNKGKAPAARAEEEEPQRIITPELRQLLSRKVEVLPRKVVADKGDGLPTERRS